MQTVVDNKLARTEQNRNVPKLRFGEFVDMWQKLKMSNISSINPKNPELPSTFIYIDLESVVKGRLIKEDSIDKIDAPSRAQRVLKKGDIIYQTVRPYQKNNYFFNLDGDYIASTGYAQIRTKEEPKFIYQLLHNTNFVNKVLVRCTGTSYPSINSSDLKDIPIHLPSLPEQQKIAAFLSSVDEKLQQLNKKKSLLEDYKKGVMQKIFSQELRFKDDNGNNYPDWEEKKLGEVFIGNKGKGLSKDKLDVEGKNKCILYGELYTTYSEQIKEVVNKTDSEEGTKSLKGDLLVPCSTTTSGIDLANVTALNEDNVQLGGDISILRSKGESICNIFYAYYLSNYKKIELAKYGQGTTIVHLYFSHFKKMKIDILKYEEQQKIANFLSAIDEKITLTNIQIDNTKAFKKGLLQQMFV